jgi:hypothetical protein
MASQSLAQQVTPRSGPEVQCCSTALHRPHDRKRCPRIRKDVCVLHDQKIEDVYEQQGEDDKALV